MLVSLKLLDAVAIVDPDAGQVVWTLLGLWHAQHSAHLLVNGHILLFDNFGTMRMASRIIEVDPFTQEIVWSYGGRSQEDLLSTTAGWVERLAGGNTLITESNSGRVIEVTPDKRVVWEFVNPNRVGKRVADGRRHQRVGSRSSRPVFLVKLPGGGASAAKSNESSQVVK